MKIAGGHISSPALCRRRSPISARRTCWPRKMATRRCGPTLPQARSNAPRHVDRWMAAKLDMKAWPRAARPHVPRPDDARRRARCRRRSERDQASVARLRGPFLVGRMGAAQARVEGRSSTAVPACPSECPKTFDEWASAEAGDQNARRKAVGGRGSSRSKQTAMRRHAAL